MTQTKKKRQLVTPFGRAGYCSLVRPSFKFAPEEGKFSARLILDAETAAPFVEQLDALYEAAYQENLATQNAERAAKNKAPLKEIKRADKPYKNVEDPDTGETLPDFQFNFGLKFRRMGKNPDTGVKEVFGTQRPIVVDSKGQPVRQEIGQGSTIRVSFIPGGFFTAALGSGLSLKLIGVQVKELVQVGLENPDFDEVEGYEAPQTKASDPVEHTEAPSGATGSVDEDAEWS